MHPFNLLTNSRFESAQDSLIFQNDFLFSLIDDDDARELAQNELSKLKYRIQESLFERFLDWFAALLERWFLNPDGEITATGIITAIAAAIFAIFLIVLSIRFGSSWRRSRKTKSSAISPATLFDDDRDSTALFAAADAALIAGDLRIALVEKFRGIIRKTEELGYLQIYPGMTASEAASLGSKTLGHELLFKESANWFNKVYYGLKNPNNEAIAVISSLQMHVVNTPKLEVKAENAVTLGGIPILELQR